MLEVRRAGERYRGGRPDRGIETWHAFSFSGFYDPDNTGFGLLVACNEERLAPRAGFPEHPHRDVEIVTWVLEGELTHEDSAGNATVVHPGDVQRLSAGAGVRHVEHNTGATPLRFLQMWLVPGPDSFGREPEYEVVRGITDGTPYALERTEALLHVRRLRTGQRTGVPDAPWVHIQVVRGGLRLGPEELGAGDAARITGAAGLEAVGAGPSELLIWEMHGQPGYG